jgi:hypothetical protein
MVSEAWGRPEKFLAGWGSRGQGIRICVRVPCGFV